MKILVFGAGAVGSVVGGLLSAGGHDVTLLGRAWHLDTVRRQGLLIRGVWGEHHVRGLRLVERPAEALDHGQPDWVLVCVKAYDTASAAGQLPPLLGPGTLVCALQNGLGNYESLAARVPPDRIALGRVISGVELEPGVATVTVSADAVAIGAPDHRVPVARIQKLVAGLSASGVPARVSDRIVTDLWAKVLYNCALNGLSTVLEASYGDVAADPTRTALMARIIREAYAVAAAHGVALEPGAPDAYVERLMQRLIPDTAAHHSSMLQDVRRGRRTEIDALNGRIAELGREAGVPTPANDLITRLVRRKEWFVRGQAFSGAVRA